MNGNRIIDFSDFIADRTRNFTGREWVFTAIDHWLADPQGLPAFLLTGEPGSGKSAVAERLVQFSQGVVSAPVGTDHLVPNFLSAIHFCSARDLNRTNPHRFAESLALQLAARYPAYARALAEKQADRQIHMEVNQSVQHMVGGQAIGIVINKLEVSGIPPEDAFVRAVREPLEVLCREEPNQRIVILVDALDEALRYSGPIGIVALLAQSGNLPEQVRLLLTSRQDERIENAFLNADGLFLSASEFNQANQADVQCYVEMRVKQDEVLVAQAAKLTAKQVASRVTAITKNSAGNFLYVCFLLDEMARGQRSLSELKGLPQGLDGLYYESLNGVVSLGGKPWDDYAPLLGVFSVAQASLTRGQLQALTGQTEENIWRYLGDLRQFIQETNAVNTVNEQERRYRLYHQSVTDFLRRPYLQVQKRQLRNRYYLPAMTWHRQIANYYWNTYHPDWSQCDGYGLDSLPIHLHGGERKNELIELLTSSPSWMQAKSAGTGGSSYIDDVELVIPEFSDPLTPIQLVELAQLYVARQVARRQAYSFTDDDLCTLVWLGRTGEAVLRARSRSDFRSRFHSLLTIYYALADKGQLDPELLGQACETASKIKQEDDRQQALVDLAFAYVDAAFIPEVNSILDEVGLMACQVGGDWWSGLINLAVRLTKRGYETEANRAFMEVRHVGEADTGWAESRNIQVLNTLSKALAWTHRFVDAEAAAREIRSTSSRTDALATLAVEMFNENLKPQAQRILGEIREAVELATTEWRTDGLMLLAGVLARMNEREEACTAFDEAERLIREMEPQAQVQGLAKLGLALQHGGFEQKATAVFEIAQHGALSLPDDAPDRGPFAPPPPHHLRTEGLRQLVEALTQAERLLEARAIAERIEDPNVRANALVMCFNALAWRQDFDEACQTLQQIENEECRAKAHRSLAMAMAKAGRFTESKNVISRIPDDRMRANTLSYLIASLAYVGGNGDIQSLLDELETIRKRLFDLEQNARALLGLAHRLIHDGCQSQAAVVLGQGWSSFQRNVNLREFEDTVVEFSSAWAAIGQYDTARELTLHIEDPYRRGRALQRLAVALADAGHPEEARAGFEQARALLMNANEDPFRRVESLGQLAIAASTVSCREMALRILADATPVVQHDIEVGGTTGLWAAEEWVQTLIRLGSLDEALKVARQIAYVPECLAQVATALGHVGRHDEALQVFGEARTEIDRRESGSALVHLAEHMWQVGYVSESRRVLLQAEQAIYTAPWATWVLAADELVDLAGALWKTGDREKAKRILSDAEQASLDKSEDSGGNRGSRLLRLANCLAETGDHQGAKRIADAIDPQDGPIALTAMATDSIDERYVGAYDKTRWPWWRARLLVVSELAKARRFSEALALAPVDDLDGLIALFVEWSPFLEQVNRELAVTILKQVIRIAGWVRPDWELVHKEIANCWQHELTGSSGGSCTRLDRGVECGHGHPKGSFLVHQTL